MNTPRLLAAAESARYAPVPAAPPPMAPDVAICAACTQDVLNPFDRRYRYPFTTCAECGPRFSITSAASGPQAAAATAFAPCGACLAEVQDPASRRFRAPVIACHACGPRARLIRLDGAAISFDQFSMLDDVDAAGSLIRKGEIVAIKGLGSYRLACDATNPDAVARLRAGKSSAARPFALMARDLGVIRDYCTVTAEEEGLLRCPAAPVVVLAARGPKRLPDTVAPGLATLGFMLPPSAMHVLMLRRIGHPVVMTSGAISGEPPIVDDEDALRRLIAVTPFALVDERPIATAVTASVVQVASGRARVIRRASGYVPLPIPLPAGFEDAPDLLAMGAGRDASACFIRRGEAILTQPLDKLENAQVFAEGYRALEHFGCLIGAANPAALITDLNPDCLAARLGRDVTRDSSPPVIQVQQDHAHIAACLAENGRALDAPPVLGIALGGPSFGENGALWGGEFLLANYRIAQRLGTFKPIAIPGGAEAMHKPWRSLYAHLIAEMGWAEFAMNFSDTELFTFLDGQPRALFDAAIKQGHGVPLVSSCAALIDAVAAAIGVCREQQSYPSETAARLEALADAGPSPGEDEDYPISIPNLPGSRLPYIEPVGLWRAVLGDVWLKTPAPVISARFHRWLIHSIAAMTVKLARRSSPDGPRFDTVALSGGCFRNRLLLAGVTRRLEADNFTVLSHAAVPPCEGGLALGQAAIGAARLIAERKQTQGNAPCVSEFPAAS